METAASRLGTRAKVNVPSLQHSLQSLLGRLGLYHRLKGSRLYDWYWRIADQRIIDRRDEQVAFYRSVLKGFGKDSLVFDIGANHGTKTDIFLRLGAKVVSVEPDETNQGILRERFLSRFRPKPVTIVGKAVSDHSAVETMWIDAPGSAKNTLSQKWVDTLRGDEQRFGHTLGFARRREVETTTLEQLFDEHGLPFFVKIDVEGFEPQVLRGLKRPVRYISFEVNLPEFRPEGLECIASLERVAADGKFNYAGVRPGLALDRWLAAEEFTSVLKECGEPSIEVFWTTDPSISQRSGTPSR
jgi:FkbM family methyltransferase